MELLEYIKWRGDLTFEERELNEIDSLIFCAFSYETLDDIFMKNKSLTINETAQIFFSLYDEEELKKRVTFSNRSYEFLKAMQNTKRYGELILSNYVNEIDHEIDLQFSAMTIENKNKWKYIVFRGTDDTITGWKEDFSMLYRDEILSHKKAVSYIKKVTAKNTFMGKMFNKYSYYIGGHSKGGNLAIYASSFLPEDIQKKIKRIDNFDGPGFKEGIWQKQSMQNILPLIRTYIPTSSLFGRLFTHPERIIVIKSKQVGLLQHNPYNWFVDVDCFQYADDVTESSDKAVDRFNQLLENIDKEESEEIIESLFTIFDRLDIYTFNDMTKIDLSRVVKTIKELSELDAKTIKILIEILGLVWDIFSIK